MLFTDRSLLTMIHGVVLGGVLLMALAAALFAVGALLGPATGPEAVSGNRMRAIEALTILIAAMLWVTVITGTYVVFPSYRASPPAGAADLAAFPRSLLLSKPETAWLHAFAMESKEHMPWIAAMLATAVAFVTARYPGLALGDPLMRRMTLSLLALCFVLAAFAGLMGTLINKVAPLE